MWAVSDGNELAIMSVFIQTASFEAKKKSLPDQKIFCFHGNMVLLKLQVAYDMSVLSLTFSQAREPAEDVFWFLFLNIYVYSIYNYYPTSA